MIIKNYKYDYSGGRIYYTIDVDGYETAMEHTKTEYGSVQRNDIDDFLSTVEEYDFQEAEMIEAFVDFQNDLLLYGIDFELIKEDVQEIFETSENDRDVMTCFSHLSRNISDFQIYRDSFSKDFRKLSLIRTIRWLKSISNALGYDFEECFELAYQEIKDRKGRWIDGTFVKEEDL
uniref:Uncharacterized protein n=1 Tax=Siphoviridae sp. ctsgc4 TaxID=2826486 RepID=A0A8S5N6U7_9CAUD|nr:MAG TPA: hypothetical protein [Siphoviridae sp. ctsgc4]